MPELFTFFIILSAGLFFSHLFNRLHLPWVVALLAAGIFVGPGSFDLYTPSDAFEFIAEVGLIFLMFMAGLESRLQDFKNIRHSILPLLLFNSLIPFFLGYGIGLLLNFDVVVSLLLGIVFTSSSIAVIIPSLEQNGVLGTKISKTLVVTVILEDALSIALLSIILQTVSPVTAIPLPIFYLFLFSALVTLSIYLPKIRRRLSYAVSKHTDLFEHELRLVFVILIGVVAFFQLFGLHPIIAGFFTGMVLSGSIQSEVLKSKLHTISYGIFIPVFFIIMGTNTDFSLLFGGPQLVLLTIAIIVGSIGAKFFSGWMGAKLSGLSHQESIFIGAASIPHLSTALAVAVTGVSVGVLTDAHATAIIAMTIVATLIGPILINLLSPLIATANSAREKS